MSQYEGILLLGPTGSGKTPLGEQIEAQGLGGRRFVHFDFGEHLRRTAAQERSDTDFSDSDREFLRSVLESGALLEDEHFFLAERVLRRFLRQRCGPPGPEIVLNGLPRHASQAEAVGTMVGVHTVVALQCTEEVILARIKENVGGDRSRRSDDRLGDIRRKLRIFAERTGPLVEYYRRAGRLVVDLPVSAEMTAQAAWGELANRLTLAGF
ncbi:MAG: nucleoside monophosphate kinase [Thermoguttaceae bacterium]